MWVRLVTWFTVADLHSKVLEPPPAQSKFFQFHAVFGKNLAKSYVGAPPPRPFPDGGLAPPPRGNPGSATGLDKLSGTIRLGR